MTERISKKKENSLTTFFLFILSRAEKNLFTRRVKVENRKKLKFLREKNKTRMILQVSKTASQKTTQLTVIVLILPSSILERYQEVFPQTGGILDGTDTDQNASPAVDMKKGSLITLIARSTKNDMHHNPKQI